MKKIKLKPCPFCGRKAQTFCTPEREYRDGEKLVAVYPKVFNAYCICGQAEAKAATAEKAAEKWNRRAPEWFSVDKVRPLGERKCLVATKKASLVKLTVAWYYGYGIWKRDYDGRTIEFKVTHWREMPNDWVDACEKLPPDEDKEAYLVKAGSKVTIAKYYGDGEWMTYSLCNITRLVTHWQPLPEAPLTEVEDETD